jgi:hypothetical protein
MQYPDWLERLRQHPFVSWREPASEDSIELVARQFGAVLPEALLQFWRASDGAGLGQFEGELLGASALSKLPDGEWLTLLKERGLLPVLHDGQSNHLVLHVTRPLSQRITYLPHDDGPRLMYRDLPSLLGELPQAFATGETADEYFAGTAQGDYAPDAPRSAADRADAELLSRCDTEVELVQAVALLDASQTEAWARLLETQHFVRREARARMECLPEPAIVELLARDAAAFAEFAQFARRAAESAGLTVQGVQGESLRIDGRSYNLDALFYRRNIPDAFSKLSDWFADRAAKRTPGPGSYLKD